MKTFTNYERFLGATIAGVHLSTFSAIIALYSHKFMRDGATLHDAVLLLAISFIAFITLDIQAVRLRYNFSSKYNKWWSFYGATAVLVYPVMLFTFGTFQYVNFGSGTDILTVGGALILLFILSVYRKNRRQPH